ncbi:glycosyltransferase family 4 protein [Candidatus Actinomarina sp.]|nr:glycosyltransferase family 4 protein [Candidatus Actinomarina sp.]
MKKILVVHNRYQLTGGEDIAVDNEIEFLKKHFQVKALLFDNKIVSKSKFLRLIFTLKNKDSVTELEKVYTEFNPDYVYIHNTWFNASLEIFRFLEKKQGNVVLKLHNFRYDCTKYFKSKNHLNNKKICPACGYRYKKLKYFNKYFEDSYAKSFFVFLYGRKYIKILLNSNFKIAVLTKFHSEHLLNLGLDISRLEILPNIIANKPILKIGKIDKSLVYAGRISNEKGLNELINSFNEVDAKEVKLKIVGDGPILKQLIQKNKNKNIEFLGQVSNQEVKKIISESIAVITATKLLEGQPTLLHEASLLKKPSIYPKTGGLSEFFPDDDPYSFEQFNYDQLVEKLRLLVTDVDRSQQIGEQNYNFIMKNLSTEIIKEKYLKLFK